MKIHSLQGVVCVLSATAVLCGAEHSQKASNSALTHDRVISAIGHHSTTRATQTASLDRTATAGDTVGPFTLNGSVATPNPAISVALNGNLAYVCTPREIVTVDITDPKSPQTIAVSTTPLINNSADIHCSVQRGVLAVFADQTGSRIGNTPGYVAFSLADPAHPQAIQETPIPKRFFESPIFLGNLAFVPTGAITYGGTGLWLEAQWGDLLAVNLTDINSPVLMSTLANPIVDPALGGAHMVNGATRAGDHLLYLGTSTATGDDTTGTALLQAIDVSNPTSMQVISQTSLPGAVYMNPPILQGAIGVSIGNTGGYGFGDPPPCCTGKLAVAIWDVSNRRNPALRSFTVTNYSSGTGGGAASIGANQFLWAGVKDSTGADVLLLIDTTNPDVPTFRTFPNSIVFHQFVVSGQTLYATADSGLMIYAIPGDAAVESPCPVSIDAALVVDTAGATTADAMASVRAAARRFLDNLQLPPDRIAVIQAGPTATTKQGLTSTKAAVSAAIDGLSSVSASYLGSAIAAAQQELLGPNTNLAAGRVILIVSDGKDAAAPASNASAQAAAAAKAAGIRILTVGYGGTSSKLAALASAPGDARAGADLAALQPVTVLDATTAMAVLRVAAGAAPGPRTCTVTTGTQSVSLAGAFTVRQPIPTATAASSTVRLLSITPSSGAAGDTISLAFDGLSGAALDAAKARITFSPVQQGTPTVVVTGSSSLIEGTRNTVAFTIPRTLLPQVPLSYSITVAGVTNSGLAFASANSLSLTVTPSAGLAGALPTGGTRNSSASVRLHVQGMSLLGATVEAVFGEGIRVGSALPGDFSTVTVTSPTSATANIRVAPDATLGARTVGIRVNGKLYTLDRAFAVIAEYGPAQKVKLVSVTPNRGTDGQLFTIDISGLPSGELRPANIRVLVQYSANGAQTARIVSAQSRNGIGRVVFTGEGLSPAAASVSLSGSTTAHAAFESSNSLPIEILAAPWVSYLPDLLPGTTVTLVIHGEGTHFVAGQTMVNFGPGVTVAGSTPGGWGTVNVTSPTDFTVTITTAIGTPAEYREYQVKTGAETVLGSISIAGPEIWFSPSSSTRGSTVEVTLTGTNTHFVQGTTTASFGPDIRVGGAAPGQPGPVTVIDAVTAKATLEISSTALPGYREIVVQTGVETWISQNPAEGSPPFAVIAPQLSMYPGEFAAGSTTEVMFYLDGATFDTGAQVNFGQGIKVGDAAEGAWAPVTIVGEHNATVSVTTSPSAPLGERTVSLKNGTDTLQTPALVSESGQILSVTPSAATAGTTTTFIIRTKGLTLTPDAISVYFGGYLTVDSAQVTAPDTISAVVTIPAGNPEGPVGVWIYTTYGSATGADLVTVNNPAPSVESVVPGGAAAGSTQTITVSVKKLTLVAGQTYVSLGEGISVAGAPIGTFGPVQVMGPNQLQFTASVSQAAAAGVRKLVVKVGTQQAEGAFDVWSY